MILRRLINYGEKALEGEIANQNSAFAKNAMLQPVVMTPDLFNRLLKIRCAKPTSSNSSLTSLLVFVFLL